MATTPKPVSSKAAKLGLKSGAQIAAEKAQAQAAVEEAKDPDNIGIVGQTAVSGQAQKMKSTDLLHFENCIDGL